MMTPTIHLNGTSREQLSEELITAQRAVGDAIAALRQVTVHGRDYYVQGTYAYTQAREEMDRREQALRQVQADLTDMFMAIQKQ